jgi:pimeloyl-ACP methyl ester carboxylesterase
MSPQGFRACRLGEARTLLTADGVPVWAVHHGPVEPAGGVVFVVAHGFTGSAQSSSVARVRATLGEYGGVVALDFRGHGRSGGRSTVGNAEMLDLDAAVRWARLLGYDQVATVGFSMGASVVIRHAALLRGVDAVVAVSGPARWHYRGTPTMRRLHYVVQRPAGRLVARLAMGTRVDNQTWDPVPAEPRALAGAVAPTPLLVVHGDRDRLFPLDHAEQLAAAGGATAELWVEPGFGHAEAAASDELVRRIGGWVQAALHPLSGGEVVGVGAQTRPAAPVRRVK